MTRWTKAIIIAAIVVLVSTSVVALAIPGDDDTVSAVMSLWARNPSVPLLVGIVMGHWFWFRRQKPLRHGRAVLIVWAGVSVLADMLGVLPVIAPLYPFAAGFCAGGLLWGPIDA